MLFSYYVRMYANVILTFFCRFWTWRLGINAQDSCKR